MRFLNSKILLAKRPGEALKHFSKKLFFQFLFAAICCVSSANENYCRFDDLNSRELKENNQLPSITTITRSGFGEFGDPFTPPEVIKDATELNFDNRFALKDSTYSQENPTSWIKFALIKRDGKPEITFQNTREYPFHSDYLATQPEFQGMTREEIDHYVLKEKERKAYIGTLLFKESEAGGQDPSKPRLEAHFEIVAHDPLSIAEVTLS